MLWNTFLVSAIKELMYKQQRQTLQRDSAFCLCHLWFKKRGWCSAFKSDFNECCQCLWELMVSKGKESRGKSSCFRIGGMRVCSDWTECSTVFPLFSLSFVLYNLIYWYKSKCRYICECDLFSFQFVYCVQQGIYFSYLGWMHKSVCSAFARCLDDHLVSLRMSGSCKEFDVKQILKIRWRWFSHQASSPNSTVDSQQGEFWNRGQTGANGGESF